MTELVPHVSFYSVFASRGYKITERGLGINRASKDQRIAELQFSLVVGGCFDSLSLSIYRAR